MSNTLNKSKSNTEEFSDKPTPHDKNLTNVIYLGVVFLILYSAYNSAQNLISQIFSQLTYENLGQIDLFIAFGVYAIANFFTPGIKKRFTYKTGFILGSSGIVLFFLAGITTIICGQNPDYSICQREIIYLINIIASILLTTFSSLLWISQASYVANASSNSLKGRYAGIFFALYQFSQIIGNLAAAILIGNLGQLSYYIIMAATVVFAQILFCFLPDINNDPSDNEEKTPKVIEEFKKVLNIIPKSIPIMSHMLLSGFAIAFCIGFLYKIIQNSLADGLDKDEVNFKTALVFMASGGAECISGLVIGKMCDTFEKIKVCKLSNIIVEVALILSLLGIYLENYGFCYVVAIVWGFADNAIVTSLSAIVALDYENKLEYFAIYRMCQGFGATFGLIIVVLVANSPLYTFVIITAAIQIVLFINLSQYKSPKALLASQE